MTPVSSLCYTRNYLTISPQTSFFGTATHLPSGLRQNKSSLMVSPRYKMHTSFRRAKISKNPRPPLTSIKNQQMQLNMKDYLRCFLRKRRPVPSSSPTFGMSSFTMDGKFVRSCLLQKRRIMEPSSLQMARSFALVPRDSVIFTSFPGLNLSIWRVDQSRE